MHKKLYSYIYTLCIECIEYNLCKEYTYSDVNTGATPRFSLENPPFPRKTLEMSGKLFKFFKNKMKSYKKSGNQRKCMEIIGRVRKSPKKSRNRMKSTAIYKNLILDHS